MTKISDSIVKFLGLEGLIQNLSGYVEARVELLKVEIREDVTKGISRALVMMCLFLIGFMFMIFFSFGLAHFLNGYYEEPYAGFWSVAGIYLATFLILLVFRKNIHQYFEQQFSGMIKTKSKSNNNGTVRDPGSGKA